MKKWPLVSVVVVNYNGKKLLRDCLGSVKKSKYPRFEIIFVENGSTDGSLAYVRKNFKGLRIYKIKKNKGFVPGANFGIKKSRGKYIILLNNDTKVHRNWIKELVETAENDDHIGALSCKVLLFHKRDRINSAGIEMDRYGCAVSRGLVHRGRFEKDRGQYEKEEEVFGAYGTAMMVRKDVLKVTGLFNPDYGMNYEDVDLAWRIRLAGYKIVYVPTSIVYHKFRQSFKAGVTEFTSKWKFFAERNRLRTILQNYSKSNLMYVVPVHFIIKMAEAFFYLINGQSVHTKNILKAFWNVYTNMGDVFKERKIVQHKIRRISDDAFMEILLPGSIEASMFLEGQGKFLKDKPL